MVEAMKNKNLFILLSFVFFCFAKTVVAQPIYIDVSDINNPSISAGGLSYGASGAYETAPDQFELYVGVVGAHRSGPSGTTYVLFEDSSGNSLFGLQLYWVNFNNLYSYSTYYFHLYTVDDSGYYSGPDWSEKNVTEINVNQQWQLAYQSIVTDLVTYDVYVKGQELPSSVPVPSTLLLFGTGLAGLSAVGRLKKR